MKVVIALLLFWSCTSDKRNSDSYSIQVVKMPITDADSIIYLYKIIDGQYLETDSVRNVPTQTMFSFTRKNESPFLAILGNKKTPLSQMFVVDNKTPLKIEINGLNTKINGTENDLIKKNRFLFELPQQLLGNKEVRGSLTKRVLNDTVFSGATEKLYLDYQDHILQTIRSYPSSFFVLYQLDFNKGTIDIKTLKQSLQLFDISLAINHYYEKINLYIKRAENVKTGKRFPDFVAYNPKGGFVRSGDVFSSKPYNLMIFWSSWCAPCRREIPHLKELFKSVDTTKIQFISFSIDDNAENWNNALRAENIPWLNLADMMHKKEERVENKASIPSIPQIYLLDNEGTILDKNLESGTLTTLLRSIKVL